jgi:hypothetical protein
MLQSNAPTATSSNLHGSWLQCNIRLELTQCSAAMRVLGCTCHDMSCSVCLMLCHQQTCGRSGVSADALLADMASAVLAAVVAFQAVLE